METGEEQMTLKSTTMKEDESIIMQSVVKVVELFEFRDLCILSVYDAKIGRFR